MELKRVVGISMLVAGIALLAVSKYISGRVKEGQEQINSTQKTLNEGSALSSMNPATKQIGKIVGGSVQTKIDQGQQDVIFYEKVATWTLVGGIIFIVVGTGSVFLKRKK